MPKIMPIFSPSAALEGLCSASVILMCPAVEKNVGFSRNASFSVKRGSSAMKEAANIRAASVQSKYCIWTQESVRLCVCLSTILVLFSKTMTIKEQFLFCGGQYT